MEYVCLRAFDMKKNVAARLVGQFCTNAKRKKPLEIRNGEGKKSP